MDDECTCDGPTVGGVQEVARCEPEFEGPGEGHEEDHHHAQRIQWTVGYDRIGSDLTQLLLSLWPLSDRFTTTLHTTLPHPTRTAHHIPRLLLKGWVQWKAVVAAQQVCGSKYVCLVGVSVAYVAVDVLALKLAIHLQPRSHLARTRTLSRALATRNSQLATRYSLLATRKENHIPVPLSLSFDRYSAAGAHVGRI